MRGLFIASSGRRRGSSSGVGRFPGDPGAGKILTGGNAYTGTDPDPGSITDGNAWLDTNTGINHLLKRNYYSDLWSRSKIIEWRNAGKMPSIAWKANATTANIAGIATGSRDADFTAEAIWAAGQGYPIYTAFWHEPEDNFESDTDAANWRSAYRRVVGIFRTNGATNVVWCGSGFMSPWSFEGGEASRGPWYKWDPDWKGTKSGSGGTVPNASDWYTGTDAVVDVLTFDTYTPEIGQSAFHEFDESMDPSLTYMATVGRPLKPWIILEMGTKQATGMPGDGWTGFFQRAFRYMRDNGGVGYVYYNTDMNNFFNAPDFAARRAGYEAALASESSYLVSTRPPDEGVPSEEDNALSVVGVPTIRGGNTQTVTHTLPSGWQPGDTAILALTHTTTSFMTPDPPTGWTVAVGTTASSIATVYYRKLQAGDTGVTLTMDGATRQSSCLVVYRGLHDTDVLAGTPGVDSTHTVGQTHNNPPVTTDADSIIVCVIHERVTSGDSDWTAPTGYSERADTGSLSVGNAGSITAIADNGLTVVSSGNTITPPVWTGNWVTGTANIVTHTLALRVAS